MIWSCDAKLLDALPGRTLIIFGAGRGGRFIAEMIYATGRGVDFFADNDTGKQGTRLGGVKILAPGEIRNVCAPYLILSSILPKELEPQFLSLGIPTDSLVDMRACIRGFVPSFLQPFHDDRIFSQAELRFLREEDLTRSFFSVDRRIYDGDVLYLRGYYFSPAKISHITVSVNDAPETVLLPTDRSDVRKATFYFDMMNLFGFEGVVWAGGTRSIAVRVRVYDEFATLLEEQSFSCNAAEEVNTLWRYVLRHDNKSLLEEARQIMDAHEETMCHRPGFAIRYCQVLYYGEKMDANWLRKYCKAISGFDHPAMQAWITEHELPSLLFTHPTFVFRGWYRWRRNWLMCFSNQWFSAMGRVGCRERTRALVLLDALGSRLMASAVLELSISRELARRGFDVHVVVQDACSPSAAGVIPIRSQRLDSSRFSKDHQRFMPLSHIHYCKREGYAERMREAYSVAQGLSPAFVVDISGWGTILSSALHENGCPVIRVPLSGYSESAVFDRYIAKSKIMCAQENKIYRSIPQDLIFEAPVHVPYDLGSYPAKEISDERLSGEAFVMVTVGNRLQYELNEDFLRAVKKVLTKEPRIRWCVVGTVLGEKFHSLMQEEVATGKAIVWGHEENLPALYRRCHVYVNPSRMGGGGSVAMAMDMGMPVAMTKFYADATPVIGLENCFDDYDAMFDYVLKLKASSEFYGAECNKMKKRASCEEFTITHYVDVILQAWEDIKKRGRWSWRENRLVPMDD